MASQRTADIIKQLSVDMQHKYTDGVSYIQTLTGMYQHYKTIADDLIKTKTRYVELVEKYSGVNSKLTTPATLPGIVSSRSLYDTQAMRADSQEIQELGDVVVELENQKDLVYSQIRKLLEAVITATSNLVDTTNQINSFLTNQITNANPTGVYGNHKIQNMVNSK